MKNGEFFGDKYSLITKPAAKRLDEELKELGCTRGDPLEPVKRSGLIRGDGDTIQTVDDSGHVRRAVKAKPSRRVSVYGDSA